ncbi:AAA family ATPase [Ilumatobacter sp.]|uniref:AAA family ATPase n=1 Tax=Ilumatobacter sp. TaxID=1967498 RepID=UPI003C507B1C
MEPDAGAAPSLDGLRSALDAVDYLVDDGLSMALYLTMKLGQPLLLEGEPGVGKTTAAKAVAEAIGADLIRLQCYEGITAAEALYEWNYPRQMLAIRVAEADRDGADTALTSDDLFTSEFLLDRPLLRSVRSTSTVPPVLLIDEIDRSDDEFEALLLEFLGEASVTVPELGTFTATRRPIVILTSNRNRELHDALKRRCYYHWIEYPSVERAAEIVRRRVPGASTALVEAATAFVSTSRVLDLDKPPGLAEAIDWVSALHALGVTEFERETAITTIGAIAKTPDDADELRRAAQEYAS